MGEELMNSYNEIVKFRNYLLSSNEITEKEIEYLKNDIYVTKETIKTIYL